MRIPLAKWQGTLPEEAVDDCTVILRGPCVAEGPWVEKAEAEWARIVGTKYAVAANSGSSAYMIGLLALMEQGALNHKQTVVVPALTHSATAAIPRLLGLMVHLAEVKSGDFTMDPEALGPALQAIGCPPAVIVAVHLMGYPCDLRGLHEAADKSRVPCILIEDACQASGTSIGSKMAGSTGAFGFFSFYIPHALGGPDMGILTTNSPVLATTAHALKYHGRPAGIKWDAGVPEDADPLEPHRHQYCASSLRANEIAACIAWYRMRDFNQIKQRRNWIIQQYAGALRSSGPIEYARFPDAPTGADLMWYAFPIILRDDIDREWVRRFFATRDIASRPLFGALPDQPWVRRAANFRIPTDGFPMARLLGRQGMYLPCDHNLTDDEVGYVRNALGDLYRALDKGEGRR